MNNHIRRPAGLAHDFLLPDLRCGPGVPIASSRDLTQWGWPSDREGRSRQGRRGVGFRRRSPTTRGSQERNGLSRPWRSAERPTGPTRPAVNDLLLNVDGVTSRREIDVAVHFQASLLAAVGQAIMAVDRAGRIIYWNDAAERMYGWSADEAVGCEVLSLIGGPDDARVVREITKRLGAGESWTGDFWTVRKDGSSFPVLVTDTPILDETGSVVVVIGVSTDITERKAAEETSSRLSAIVASSTDAIYSWTLDGIVQTWNAAAERLFGLRAEDVVGNHVTVIEADYRTPEIEAFLSQIEHGEQIEPVTVQRNARRSDDGRRLGDRVADPATTTGSSASRSSLATSPEICKKHEEALSDRRRLVEAQHMAGLGSFEHAFDSGTTTWSQQLYQLLDLAPTMEPSLGLYLTRTHPAEHQSVKSAFETAAAGDDVDLAHRVRRPDGDRWARLRLRPDGSGLTARHGSRHHRPPP